MKNFPIKFADDLICFNVIGNKDKPKTKVIGYFTMAKNVFDARLNLKKLARIDTSSRNPFKLWNSWLLLGHVMVVRSINKKIEQLMKNTEDHQKECIHKLKGIMKNNVKYLIGNEDLAYWTYMHCSKRQYFMFDPDGAAIEERVYLNDVLKRYRNYDKKIRGNLYFQEFVVTY